MSLFRSNFSPILRKLQAKWRRRELALAYKHIKKYRAKQERADVKYEDSKAATFTHVIHELEKEALALEAKLHVSPSKVKHFYPNTQD